LLGEHGELLAKARLQGPLDTLLDQVYLCRIRGLHDDDADVARTEKPLRGRDRQIYLIVLVTRQRTALLHQRSDDPESLTVDVHVLAQGVLVGKQLLLHARADDDYA